MGKFIKYIFCVFLLIFYSFFIVFLSFFHSDFFILPYFYDFEASILKEENLKGKYPLPFMEEEYVITDFYGEREKVFEEGKEFHHGIDLALRHHCNIVSIEDGTVIKAESDASYGNYVVIKHEDKEIFYSLYAHLSKIYVKAGDKVKQGEVIGKEGGEPNVDENFGESTGHHLHFEIRNKDFNSIDPLEYLPLVK